MGRFYVTSSYHDLIMGGFYATCNVIPIFTFITLNVRSKFLHKILYYYNSDKGASPNSSNFVVNLDIVCSLRTCLYYGIYVLILLINCKASVNVLLLCCAVLVCTSVLAVFVNVLVAMLAMLICYCVSVFYISWLFCVLKKRIWMELRFTRYLYHQSFGNSVNSSVF